MDYMDRELHEECGVFGIVVIKMHHKYVIMDYIAYNIEVKKLLVSVVKTMVK